MKRGFLSIFLIFLFLLIPVLSVSAEGETYSVAYTGEFNGGSGSGQDGSEMAGPDRLEWLNVHVSPALTEKGNIEYKVHNEEVGWGPWVPGQNGAGASGKGIQAVRIRLTGKLQYYYDVYYRVHSPNVGWSNWARNGAACGSEGLGHNVNIIRISLTQKGDAPGPEPIDGAFTQARWAWPLPAGNTSISSPFGPRNGTHHDGTDIPAAEGTPIFSAKAGTVTLAGWAGNFGNCVGIEHDAGENVYYAHQSSIAVVPGQHVERGQVIGYVGNTGNSLGPHLHMEVYTDTDELVSMMGKYY